jgi:hypothetical protein
MSVTREPSSPTPTRGRRPERELMALRERIEALMLGGLRAPAIHRALTGPENPAPIAISAHQVRVHMRTIEASWQARASAQALEADRARALAMVEEAMRTAQARSTLNARSNVGVGYLNAALKAMEQWIRLRGLAVPMRTELTGPDGSPLAVVLADHPAEHLDSAEQARRLRQLATDLEAEVATSTPPRAAGA